MVIGETVVELQDVHHAQLSLDPIPTAGRTAHKKAHAEYQHGLVKKDQSGS